MEVLVYRGLELVASHPTGIVRRWGFWAGGAQLAIYTGALHGGGFYYLLDIASGAIVDRRHDPVESTPRWLCEILTRDPRCPTAGLSRPMTSTGRVDLR